MRINGFSLIELSIVIVILGLILGGILSGKTLIHASEIRSISADLSKHRAAFFAFRDKYFQLPGDITNATSFWGSAGGVGHESDATCIAVSSTSMATCNGNGSGLIGIDGAFGEYYERFHAWKHLSNAGLIEGSYTGAAGGSGTNPTEEPIIGVNVPASKMGLIGFSIYTLPQMSGNTDWFNGDYGNLFCVGTKLANSTCGKAFQPIDVNNIDLKIDDGKPATGNVRSFPSTNSSITSCTDAATAVAKYRLDLDTIECSFTVLIGM